MEIVVILSILIIAYTYVGYPLLLMLLPAKKTTVAAEPFHPGVTIIIAVHQGERDIQKKLDNTIAVDYPPEHIEIIVVSDGSEDATSEIVEAYHDTRVHLIRQIPRQGKTAAQKKAIKNATQDILVFTDLTTMLEKDSLANLIQNLSDPEIGLVSSQDVWLSADGTRLESGQSAYVKYEMWLRDNESRVNSIVSASGCFYAVRKQFFESIPDYLIDDIVIPMTVVERGGRAVHNRRAVSLVPEILSADREFMRRARMTLGGINALAFKKHMLNPFRFGLFAFQLLNHKLLRWLVPIFMISAFVGNCMLIGAHPAWNLLLVAQVTFFLIAFYGYAHSKQEKMNKIVKLIYFFVASNMSLLLAWYQFFTQPKQTTWTESRGR